MYCPGARHSRSCFSSKLHLDGSHRRAARKKGERGRKKKSVVKTQRENAVCVPLSATGDRTSGRVGQESHQDVEPFPKHTSQSSAPRVIESNPEPRAGANHRAAEGETCGRELSLVAEVDPGHRDRGASGSLLLHFVFMGWDGEVRAAGPGGSRLV